jgi:ribosomal-protein-alanine N-acetyltransferase
MSAGLAWPDPLPGHGPVLLRPFRVSDLALVEELSLDPYVPQIGTVPVPYTEAAGLAYLERQRQRLADGAGWSFAIADRASDQALGTAGLWLHPDRPATAGYVVAPSARGRGVATAALNALTAFGWTHEDVDRIELFVEPWNAASITVAERCGYALDGLFREHTLIGGQLRDMLRYAATRPAAALKT